MNKLARGLKRFVKHRKPEICMVLGTALGLGAIVTACYQTSKGGKKVIDDHKARLAEAKALPDDDPNKKKEVTMAYVKTGAAGARLYAGPAFLFATSIASFYTAHHTMKVRNAGLAAAATALRKEFKSYRNRVADELGEEAEEKLYFGTQSREIEEVELDDNGEEKTTKNTYDDVVDDIERSDFVRYFAKGNDHWDRSPDMNEFFLECQKNRANDILKTKGEITLNEVYELLGFERTDSGVVFGWIYDKYQPFGDNKVEFKYKKVHIPNESGVGSSIGYAIDFNVYGNIYEEKRRRKGLKSFRQR
jgi:hypothetical protein